MLELSKLIDLLIDLTLTIKINITFALMTDRHIHEIGMKNYTNTYGHGQCRILLLVV